MLISRFLFYKSIPFASVHASFFCILSGFLENLPFRSASSRLVLGWLLIKSFRFVYIFLGYSLGFSAYVVLVWLDLLCFA